MVSTAITRPAPSILALAIANWPTGPRPETTAVSPSPTSAILVPKYPVGKMSESMVASSSEMLSGSLIRPTLANGIRAYSARRPLIGQVSLGPPKKTVPAAGPFGSALSHWA